MLINAAIVLVIIFIGYKVYEKNFAPVSSQSKEYALSVGFYSIKGKESFEALAPALINNFKKDGLNIKLNYVLASDFNPESPIDWDFSITSALTVLTQLKYHPQVKPILWIKECNLESAAIVLANSEVTLSDMAKKKIIIYKYTYHKAAVLKSLKDWGLEEADLYNSENGIDQSSINALREGKVDMIVSEMSEDFDRKKITTVVTGDNLEEKGFKILKRTNYGIPCRTIAASSRVSDQEIEKFINSSNFSADGKFNGFKKVDPQEFNKLKDQFDWSELDGIEKKIKDFTSL